MGTVEIVNLDDLYSIQNLLDLEYSVCLFYMRYVAFGFQFSGNMGKLMDLFNQIKDIQIYWSYMHRN